MAQPPLLNSTVIINCTCSSTAVRLKTLNGFKKASAPIHKLDLKHETHSLQDVRLRDFHTTERQDQQQKITEITTVLKTKTIP